MTAFEQEQAIARYTELMKCVYVGAYEERSAEHHAAGTYPDDGIEEGLDRLERAARELDLEFNWDGRQYILVPIPGPQGEPS